MVPDILLKPPIQQQKVFQLSRQRSPLFGKGYDLLQFRKPDPVLHEFRDSGLDLMDISLLFQIAAQHLKLRFQPVRHNPQDQIFPRIV